MLASVAVLPADRHASAFRRFPPGCGRHTNAAARLPPRYPLKATAASEPPLPNPSPARAADKTAPPQPRRTLPAASSSGAAGPVRGVGSGRKAAAAVTARRVSAVRRYPPGCGRGVAAPKPPASMGEGQGEASAGKTAAVVCDGYAKARPGDLEVALRVSALDDAEFNSNGGMQNEGGGDAGAQEGVGGKPWVVTGLMAVPFLPWAQYGRRS
ncbi:hypothetical protein GQ55_4G338900 [Panicum hallii var. hallii]|uniref:Uncharacterized protein n=1 Tax=Panicum hallii var. hallii TaxID=1504633 RepID=A0A2T7E315_9POAL|nr:hypothetical protein GQ55_4G338900 [Panicum hallii var. hallii]